VLTAEAQALLFGAQVEILGVQLVLELTFEVVEQIVPAHIPTVVGPSAGC
jgi:hypothetical protein